jgi:hypothetical protein
LVSVVAALGALGVSIYNTTQIHARVDDRVVEYIATHGAGPQGEPGERGPAGERGPRGFPGRDAMDSSAEPSPCIVVPSFEYPSGDSIRCD